MSDIANFSVINGVYAEVFGDHRPARSAIAVAGLPLGGLVEIEAVAYRVTRRRRAPPNLRAMAGGIAMVIVLVLFPFVVTTTTVVIAALVGIVLDRDGAGRNEGSELLDTNY